MIIFPIQQFIAAVLVYEQNATHPLLTILTVQNKTQKVNEGKNVQSDSEYVKNQMFQVKICRFFIIFSNFQVQRIVFLRIKMYQTDTKPITSVYRRI